MTDELLLDVWLELLEAALELDDELVAALELFPALSVAEPLPPPHAASSKEAISAEAVAAL